MPTAPGTIPPITAPLPLTSDPANFDPRADQAWIDLQASIAANNLANAVTYANALEVFNSATDIEAAAAVASASTDLVAFSTSTLTVSAGSLTIHFASPKTGFAVNDQVAVILRSDTTIKMFGTVATFDGVDDMTVTVISSGVFGGGGPFSSWVIVSAAFLTAGATTAQVQAMTSDAVALTPADMPTILAMATALAAIF